MSVLKTKDGGGNWTSVPSIKGDTGDAAGFGTVVASVDANHGTPSVTVTTSGDDTAKNFDFAFHNLQPAPYDDSELQQDFATLQAQFDTAVSAVTTDTEVTDIRVGADGVTDTTAGASVRRQFTDLKSDINFLHLGLIPIFPYKEHIYISETDGSEISYNSWYATDFIELPPLTKTLTIKTTYQNQGCSAFYDSSKAFISNFTCINGTSVIDVPSNAVYFRFSNSNITKQTTTIRANNSTTESIKKTSVSQIVGRDGYVDSSGAFQATSAWKVTDYIPVQAIKSIVDYTQTYANVPYIVYYDKYKVFIGSESEANNSIHFVSITIPTNACYARLNYFKADTAQYYTITTDEMKSAAITIKNLNDALYAKKLACAGDSITIGTYSAPNMTYVHQIANAHNMAIDNQAVWGSVFPQGKTSGGNPRGSIYDQIALMSNDADVVIISGGINDGDYFSDDSYWGAISNDYTSTLDTTTFCGAFEATLRDALAKWKGKPILFVFEHRMTVKYHSDYGTHFEDVQYPLMIQMLHKWGVPYVDLFYDMPSIKFIPDYIPLYSFDDQGVHPNVAGYRKFYVPRVESKLIDISN